MKIPDAAFLFGLQTEDTQTTIDTLKKNLELRGECGPVKSLMLYRNDQELVNKVYGYYFLQFVSYIGV